MIILDLMAGSQAADRFTNSVADRWEDDTVIKPSLTVAIVILPLLIGWIFLVDTMFRHEDFLYLTDEEFEAVLIIGMLIGFLVEIAVVSFLIFYVNLVNIKHQVRDSEWMDSLCEYVREKGGDASEMERIAKVESGRIRYGSRKISLAIWALFSLALVALGFYIHEVGFEITSLIAFSILFVIIPFMVLLLLQLLFTVRDVFSLPFNHDKGQVEFTKEFQTQCASFGLEVPSMEPSFKWNRHRWVHVILMVITVGIYAILFVMMTCRRMNRHLTNQWDYEDDILQRIVQFEGGVGIGVQVEEEGRELTLKEKILDILSFN